MRVLLSGGPEDGEVYDITEGARIFRIGDGNLPHGAYHATGQTDPSTGLPTFAYRPPDLVKEGAPGREHEGIRGSLLRWAIHKGFEVEITDALASGGQPDVFRSDKGGGLIFLGDAKDSENETTQRFATFERIRGYWEEFTALITAGPYRGGIFAIATNSKGEAELWAGRLADFAAKTGLMTGTGIEASGGVEEIARRTWVATMSIHRNL